MRTNYKSPSVNTLAFLLLYVPFYYCGCFINWLVTGKRCEVSHEYKAPLCQKDHTQFSKSCAQIWSHHFQVASEKVSTVTLSEQQWHVTKARCVSSPVWMERGLIKVGWPRMIPGRCWAGSGLKSACFLFPSRHWGTVEMGELGRFRVQIHF